MINLGITKKGKRLKRLAKVKALAKRRYPHLNLTDDNFDVLTDTMLEIIIAGGFIGDNHFEMMGVDNDFADRDEYLAENPHDATVSDIERQGAEELARVAMSYEDERPNFMDAPIELPPERDRFGRVEEISRSSSGLDTGYSSSDSDSGSSSDSDSGSSDD